MTVRINKQKINLREKLTEFEDRVNFDEVVRGLGEYTGNVGIGTASPVAKLDIGSKKSGYYGPTVIIDSQASTAKLRVDDESNNATVSRMYITHNYVRATDVDGYVADTDSVGVSKLGFDNGNIIFANAAAGASVPLERMRIDSAGNLLVGVTSFSGSTNGKKISVSDNAILESSRGTTSSGSHIRFWNPNGIVGSITTSGLSTSYNTSSDYRLKTDVQPMTGAIERLKALKPVNFEWIADGTRVDGFLAHEAQEVVPEAVTGTKDAMQTEEYEVTPAVYEDVIIPAVDEVVDEDGNVITEAPEERTEQKLVSEAVMGEREVPDYQGIDQSKLVPLLTAAIQEQQSIIEDLKSRIETLESK